MCTASCTVPLAVIPPSTNSLDTICETLCSCFETTMTYMAANFVHFAFFLAHRLEEPKAVIDICQSPLAGALLASPRVWRVSGGRKWGSSPWCRAPGASRSHRGAGTAAPAPGVPPALPLSVCLDVWQGGRGLALCSGCSPQGAEFVRSLRYLLLAVLRASAR